MRGLTHEDPCLQDKTRRTTPLSSLFARLKDQRSFRNAVLLYSGLAAVAGPVGAAGVVLTMSDNARAEQGPEVQSQIVRATGRSVTIAGISFDIDILPVSLTELDQQTQRYRQNDPDATPPLIDGETFWSDARYSVSVEVQDYFRVGFGRGPNGRGFAMDFERCPSHCGLDTRSSDSAEYETAVEAASGQRMERARIVVYDGVEGSTSYFGAAIIAADHSGRPIRVTTPDGTTGYLARLYGLVTDTEHDQNSPIRGYRLLVEPTNP